MLPDREQHAHCPGCGRAVPWDYEYPGYLGALSDYIPGCDVCIERQPVLEAKMRVDREEVSDE